METETTQLFFHFFSLGTYSTYTHTERMARRKHPRFPLCFTRVLLRVFFKFCSCFDLAFILHKFIVIEFFRNVYDLVFNALQIMQTKTVIKSRVYYRRNSFLPSLWSWMVSMILNGICDHSIFFYNWYSDGIWMLVCDSCICRCRENAPVGAATFDYSFPDHKANGKAYY